MYQTSSSSSNTHTTDPILTFVNKQRTLLQWEREAEEEQLERQSSHRAVSVSIVDCSAELSNRYNAELSIAANQTAGDWMRVGESILLFKRDAQSSSSSSSGAGGGAGGKRAGGNDKSSIRGVISTFISDQRIIVTVDSMPPSEWDNTPGRVLMARVVDDVTHRRMADTLDAMESMVTGGTLDQCPCARTLRVAFGLQQPDMQDAAAVESRVAFYNTQLNESQRDAIRFALRTKDISLVLGPPGTGKTTTVVELVRIAVEQYKQRVLVVAPSNVAIDNICERLSGKRIKMVRMGHPARLMDSVMKHSMDYQLSQGTHSKMVGDIRREIGAIFRRLSKLGRRDRAERDSLRRELRLLRKELRQREKQAVHDVIRFSQVVLTTTTGACDTHLRDKDFDLVVVDEAAQALEVATWMAMLKGKRSILAGDPYQLPPTIISEKAKREGLEVTLFERLYKTHKEAMSRMLTVQYRMNEEIMRWSSDEFYDGKLVAHESVKEHLLCDMDNVEEDAEETITPLFLIDTAGYFMENEPLQSDLDRGLGDSKSNENEAETVKKHTEKLLQLGVREQDIAIISPYAAQVQLLKSKLATNHPFIEIGTVDGFQGREKEAIVISMVRSNTKGEVGFLADQRRINVAITRARRHVCVVADSNTMRTNKFLQHVIKYFEDNADIRSAEDYI